MVRARKAPPSRLTTGRRCSRVIGSIRTRNAAPSYDALKRLTLSAEPPTLDRAWRICMSCYQREALGQAPSPAPAEPSALQSVQESGAEPPWRHSSSSVIQELLRSETALSPRRYDRLATPVSLDAYADDSVCYAHAHQLLHRHILPPSTRVQPATGPRARIRWGRICRGAGLFPLRRRATPQSD